MTAGTFAVIAGGGTAGHVTPGIAVARALVARHHPAESLHFVGAERGVETDLVPAAGFPLTVLPGRGIQRRLTVANVAAALGLVVAVIRAIVLVGRLRPRVVLATGGFASVSCVVAAVLWRVPIVVAEQNAVPGAANRLAARFARACAVSFDGTELPRAILTGNPVRDEVLDAAASASPGPGAIGAGPGRARVLVFGGSLGARRINEAALEWMAATSLPIHVRHVIGRRDWTSMSERAADLATRIDYEPVAYEHDMASTLVATDLAVCRAGASTVAELAVTGTPSLLIPLPGAPGDHQTANARALDAVGAAVVVADVEIDATRLEAEVAALVADDRRLAEMAAAARRFARLDAADRVADLVEEHAR